MADKIFYDGKYKPLAQKLRREMTRQEKHLWYDYLKPHALTFRRQKQFGSYIGDCSVISTTGYLTREQGQGNREQEMLLPQFL